MTQYKNLVRARTNSKTRISRRNPQFDFYTFGKKTFRFPSRDPSLKLVYSCFTQVLRRDNRNARCVKQNLSNVTAKADMTQPI